MMKMILSKLTRRRGQEGSAASDRVIDLDTFWNREWENSEEKPSTENRTGAGWVSPVYSQSRHAQVNLSTAMENRCVACGSDSPEAEPYRVLRTQILRQTVERQWNTLMVTSALPGEGKTMTAINLALTFARHFNRTVLLVDCDLKKPSVYKYLGLSGEQGLVDCLLDGKPLDEVIVWPGIEKLTIISGGRAVIESAELLGSPRMKEILADMKGRYPDRYIILDGPPILTGADALVLIQMVDAVVTVVQSGKTPADDLREALEHVPADRLLGLVLNRQKTPSKRYGSGRYS